MSLDISEIENFIKQGRLEDSLDTLNKHSDSPMFHPYKDEILYEQSRLKSLETKHYSGIISFEEYQQSLAKIRVSVITMLGNIRSQKDLNNIINPGPVVNESDKLANEEKAFVGVWGCKHSSHSPELIHFWSLLPDSLCIVNIFNKKSGQGNSTIGKWEYDKTNKVIVQTSKEGEIKGVIEWATPTQFKLTVLDFEKTIMLYEKII